MESQSSSKYTVKFLDIKTAQTPPPRVLFNILEIAGRRRHYESRYIDVDVEADCDSQAIRLGWQALEKKLGRVPFRSDFHCLGPVRRDPRDDHA